MLEFFGSKAGTRHTRASSSGLKNALEVAAVVAIFGVALGLRLVWLLQHPYPWSGDEATVGTEAQQVLASRYPDLFNAGWSGNPFPAFIPTGIMQLIMGHSILAVRTTSAIIGALAVLFLYLLARELFGLKVALIAAAFLSSFPYHLNFSRVGFMTIQDTMVVTVTLWLVARALRTGRLSTYLWAGIASGLTVFAYVGGRWVLVLAVVFLAFVAWRTRRYLRLHVRQLAVYVGATAVTLAPMVVFFLQHLQDFGSRFNQVSIIQSGWLAHERARPGKTLASILLDQFTRSTLVYIAQPASGNFLTRPAIPDAGRRVLLPDRYGICLPAVPQTAVHDRRRLVLDDRFSGRNPHHKPTSQHAHDYDRTTRSRFWLLWA